MSCIPIEYTTEDPAVLRCELEYTWCEMNGRCEATHFIADTCGGRGYGGDEGQEVEFEEREITGTCYCDRGNGIGAEEQFTGFEELTDVEIMVGTGRDPAEGECQCALSNDQ